MKLGPWCQPHWDSAREKMGDRPGALIATLALTNAFMNDPRIVDELDDAAKAPQDPNVPLMNMIVKKHTPLCCYVGEKRLDEIITNAIKTMDERPKG